MKKLMMLLAILALALAAAVPAVAQVEQGFEQETESGDFAASFETANEGDNSNVCAPALQFGNTGNVQNAQGALQYASTADEFEFEAEDQMVFEPSLETECVQDVQQSSAASSS